MDQMSKIEQMPFVESWDRHSDGDLTYLGNFLCQEWNQLSDFNHNMSLSYASPSKGIYGWQFDI